MTTKKATVLLGCVLASVVFLGLVEDGVILPAGSNTLKSLHMEGYPGLGIYAPVPGQLLLGDETGGMLCTSGEGCEVTSGSLGLVPGLDLIWAEFIGADQVFFAGAINGGATAPNEAESGHESLLLNSSHVSNANSGAYFRVKSGSVVLSGGEKFWLLFRAETLTDVVGYFGFHYTATAAAPVDAASIRIVGTTLDGFTSAASSTSSTSTDHTITTAVWYWMEVAVDSNASLVTFSLYNDGVTLLWSDTLATNIPTAATSTGTNVWKTSSGLAELLTYDFIATDMNIGRTLP